MPCHDPGIRPKPNDQTGTLIRQVLVDIEPLITAVFRAVDFQPVPDSNLDQASRRSPADSATTLLSEDESAHSLMNRGKGPGRWEALWNLVAAWCSLAELRDKSQLMAMTFATRFRFWTVLAGITAATAVVHLISVALGVLVGVNLPTNLINLAAGGMFIGFGLWTLRGDTLSEDEEQRVTRATRPAFFAVAGAFFLAELGDKTMLATVTLATTEGWFGVWVGSTLGMAMTS